MFRLFMLFMTLSWCCVSGAYATPILSTTEKDTLVQWVQSNAQTDLSTAKAVSIVKYTYLHAFKNEIDPILILSVLKVESGYRDKVVSSYGARGIAQVVPRWHRDKIKGRSLTNTAVSIEVGTRVLKDCSNKFKGNVFKALGCYSGGGGRKYYNKVMKQKQEIRRNVIEAQRRSRSRESLYASYSPK